MNTDQQAVSPKVLRRVLGATLVGSSLEWYDFFLYATASALVFGSVFFPTDDPSIGTLLALATFGVGFFARPVGAVVFGYIGDRYGRKPALVATLILMGVTTALIGLVPSYQTIGVWAPVCLVVLRLLQGFGAGAEHAGATVFSTEYASQGRRGVFGSFPSSGLYIGVLLSSSTFGLFAMLPEEQFVTWGWRIPFLVSFVLVGIGLFMRMRIAETPEFRQIVNKQQERSTSPLVAMFRHQWRSVLVVLGIVAGPFTATYVYQTYSLAYMRDRLEVSSSYGTTGLIIAALVATGMIPVAGWLSDLFGRRPIVILGSLASAGFAFPFFALLSTRSEIGVVVAMIGGIGIGVPLMLGPQGALLTELFSAENRFSGFSVSREIGALLFAGFTPMIAAVLVAAAGGNTWLVSLYVIVGCALTLVTAAMIRETADPRGTRRQTATVAHV
ncbi:MFS transporter [Mycolicibacterium smegmatis]|uniref:Putative proline/betaine transporter n=1 Tax=Mycolicibacterium smegmatis (strain MKD8) TaxID=1214915 RepID=A0A2U9PIL7_MYCSE|nr:MFS transporter [Mycolicibacterium smegmatis]AWT51577.1 shikimate transporter [Mycolicibacterium smegmatis MKD8]